MSKKPKTPKAKTMAKPKKNRQMRQWVLSVLGSIACLALIGIFVVMVFRPVRPMAAKFLPAERTLGYVEVSGESAPVPLQSFFEGHGWMRFIAPLLSSFIDSADESRIFSDGGATAFLKKDEKTIWPVIMLPVRDKKALDDFSEKLKGVYSVMIGPYLAVSTDVKALELLTETAYEPLKKEPLFEKSSSQLPRTPWIRGYLNSASFPLLPHAGAAKDLVDPLQKIIDHLSFTFEQDQQGIKLNAYMAFQPAILEAQEDTTPAVVSSYKLTGLLSAQDILAYVGGANLNQEWQNTLQTLQNMNPSYAIIFEGLLGAQVKRLFGDGIHLRNDIYPLFDGEYALAINGQTITLLLTHTDRTFVETKMKKLLEGFRVAGAQFVPRMEVYDLPDGTKSRVLVADPERMKERNEDYEGYHISCIEISSSVYGFCYSVMEKTIVMSNAFSGVQKTIDLSLRPRSVLSQYQPFRKSLSRLARVSNEITFLNLESLGAFKKLDWLQPFGSATWVKQYFRDGMSAEGYFLLK